MEQEYHKMVLETVHESGAEEWYCPKCGRRFLMHWPPEYKKTVLEPGDEYATHTGGKGLPGMEMNFGGSIPKPAMSEPLDEPKPIIDEEKLMPLKNWMEKVDFEGLWHRPIQ